jgi:L-amino acid N-acyltransferase YncA
MTLHIRKAGTMDARAMAELLNAIISKGGTTAYVEQVTRSDLAEWMSIPNAIWHLAENDKGQILGFQWIEEHSDSPKDIANIATFVRVGDTGLGIGSALFKATCDAAQKNGYRSIDAVIRADNESGLSYYQSRGFETLKQIKGVRLNDGTLVDKIQKRYALHR